MSTRAIALLLVAACRSDDASPASPSPTPIAVEAVDAALAPPARVVLGDCAPVGTSFVSGPKPAAFSRSMFVPGELEAALSHLVPRSERPPMLTIEKSPIIDGGLDAAIIRRFIKRNSAKLELCYEKELVTHKKLAGVVTASWTIAATGEVQDVITSGVDPRVAACVRGVLETVLYPKPHGLARVKRIAFTYRPPEPATPPPPYTAGAMNPLRGHEQSIAVCLAASSTTSGVAVVDVRYEPSGAVIEAVVHGVDAAPAACIAALAKQAARIPPNLSDDRCSLAFGTMDVTALPTLDLDKTGASGIAAFIAAGSGPNGVPVAIGGPVVVRGGDEAQVAEAMDELSGSNRFDALTADQPMPDLPVVPVPFGTGARW